MDEEIIYIENRLDEQVDINAAILTALEELKARVEALEAHIEGMK